MSPSRFEDSAWQCTKVGAGAVPIRTSDGWLMFYHGVITTCNGFRYSMGAALLDLDDPSKVIARTQPHLLAPAEMYEMTGDVPNVVFPCSLLPMATVAVYYGAADTSVCLVSGYISEIVEFIKRNSLMMISRFRAPIIAGALIASGVLSGAAAKSPRSRQAIPWTS